MALSNTLQPLRLVHKHNVVTRSIGVVFVHTLLKGSIGDHTKLQGKLWGELKHGVYGGTIDQDELFNSLSSSERQVFNDLVGETNKVGVAKVLNVEKI